MKLNEYISNQMLKMGLCFARGDRSPDRKPYWRAARNWFSEAQIYLNPIGSFNLGVMTFHGLGQSINHDQARYHFLTAALDGYREGFRALAIMAAMGYGCEQNDAEAQKFLLLYHEGLPKCVDIGSEVTSLKEEARRYASVFLPKPIPGLDLREHLLIPFAECPKDTREKIILDEEDEDYGSLQ